MVMNSLRGRDRWSFLLIVGGLVASAALPQIAEAGTFSEDTGDYLRRLELLGFSGVVSVRMGDQVLYEQGHGLASREENRPWTPETVSTVGSITKQFTAALIMKLAEEGALQVTDTLTEHFDNVPEDKRGITLHQLLSHSSGILDPEGVDDFEENTRDEYVTRVLSQPLGYEPGNGYEYANANFSLLGAIAEQLTGLSYEDALRDRILEPAKMTETGYRLPAFTEDRLAIGYRGGEVWGTILSRPMAEDGPFWALRANGGIHSTVGDMQRWGQVLLGDEVLTASSRERMWSPITDEGGGESFYGYGWVVRDQENGTRIITHNGGNGIHFADFYIVPDRELVVFLQTNVIADFRYANRLGEQILARALEEEDYPPLPDLARTDVTLLPNYAGRYLLPDGGAYEVSVDGLGLVIECESRSAYALLHSEPGTDPESFAGKDRLLDDAVGRYLAGDVGGFFDAYQGRVPLETLEEDQPGVMERMGEDLGRILGHTILGSQTSPRGVFTLTRIDGETGERYRPYVWSEEGDLLGYMPRPDGLARRFFAEGNDAFMSWSPVQAGSSRIRFVTGPQGGTGMQVSGPEGPMAWLEEGKQ